MANHTSAKIFLTCALVGVALGTIARVLIRSSSRKPARNILHNTQSTVKKVVKSRNPKKSLKQSKSHLATSHHHAAAHKKTKNKGD